MRILNLKPRADRTRSWVTETLIVAGVLAFGFFAISLETAPQQWAGVAKPVTDLLGAD